MIFELTRGAHRDLNETGKLAFTLAAASFREVGSNGRSSPPDLTRQAKHFLSRKVFSVLVQLHGQLMCFVQTRNSLKFLITPPPARAKSQKPIAPLKALYEILARHLLHFAGQFQLEQSREDL